MAPVDEVQAIRTISDHATASTAEYLKDPSNEGARVKARTAAYNLFLELQSGSEAFLYRMEMVVAADVLRYLMSLGIVEAIPIGQSIGAAELAHKLGCERSFLVRLMRVLVAAGVFAEVSQDTYSHTKRSQDLLEPGFAWFYEIMMDDFYSGPSACLARLEEYYSTHEKKTPDDPMHNPYNWSQGMDGKDWHMVFARNPDRLKKVGAAFGSRWATMPVCGIYPFKDLVSETQSNADRAFIVDVGGAIGGSMKELKQAHPDLQGKFIVQDQPHVIGAIPENYLPSDIEPMAADFWQPQPVKNAKIYYLRRVLHDWPDAECIKILTNQADAMADDSILLIAEMVVPKMVQREDCYVYWMDLTMMMFAGGERSEADWRRLFDQSGLELVKIWPSAVGTQCVIEGKKKRS